MAYATNRWEGDNLTQQYEFQFAGGYLDKSHVLAYYQDKTTGDVLPIDMTTVQWITSFTLRFPQATAGTHDIVIYRHTPRTPLVNFTNEDRISESNLDRSYLQALFVAVESLDRAEEGGGGTGAGGVVNWADVVGKPFASSTVPGIFKVGSGLSMALDGTLSALGGSGGGTPTGAAGGVLGGFYPNPTFAQPMASVAVMNAALAGKADVGGGNATGTWPISITGTAGSLLPSNLIQEGATLNQVLGWDGSKYRPMTISGGGVAPTVKRIVVIGDSNSATNPNLGEAWPNKLETLIKGAGAQVEVINLSLNGLTYYQANTSVEYGTQTTVDKAIALAADVYIVVLGFNDTIGATGPVDARTLSQVQADALSFYTALRAGRPTAAILYGQQVPYDATHSTPAALLNRHVLPIHMQVATTGILANTYNPEILGNAVSAGYRTNYGNWQSLDTYIQAFTQHNGSFIWPLWNVVRLGAGAHDALHLREVGHQLMAGVVYEVFRTHSALTPIFPGLVNQDYPSWSSFIGLFNEWLTDGGTEWTDKTPTFLGTTQATYNTLVQALQPRRWFYPTKATLAVSATSTTSATPFSWYLTGAQPNTEVFTSLDGGAWGSQGFTSSAGNFIGAGLLGLATGTYTFRYKCGSEVYGPVAVTVTAVANNYALTTGTNATGTWPISITGAAPWANVSGKPVYFPGACGAGLGLIATQSLSANAWTRVKFAVGANVVITAGAPIISAMDPVNGLVFQVTATGIYRLSFTATVGNAAAGNLFLAGLVMNEPGGVVFTIQGGSYYAPTLNYAGTVMIDVTLRMPQNGYAVPVIYSLGAGQTVAATAGGTNTGHFHSITYVGPAT